jgi:hypothetical protein
MNRTIYSLATTWAIHVHSLRNWQSLYLYLESYSVLLLLEYATKNVDVKNESRTMFLKIDSKIAKGF